MNVEGVRGRLSICVIFGAIVAIGASLGGISSTEDGEFVLWTGVLGAVLALPVALTMKKATIRLDHPSVIMALVLSLYWLLGLFGARYDADTLCVGTRDYVGRSALAGVIAAVSYYVGAGLPSAQDLPEVAKMSSRGMAFWFGVLALLWATRVSDIRAGNYFTHAAVGGVDTNTITANASYLAAVLRVAPSILAVSLWRKHKAIAIAIFATDFGYMLFSGSRLYVIHIGLMLGIAASFYNRRIPFWAVVAPTLGFMLVVNPLVYRLRTMVAMDQANVGLGPSEVISTAMSTEPVARDGSEVSETFKRASASGFLAEVVCLADKGNFLSLQGSTYADSFFVLIPRAIWKDKPDLPESSDMVGVVESRLGLPMNDGLGNPIMEGYINFGYLGVVVVFVTMGLLSRWLWAYRMKNWTSTGRLGLYLMALLVFFLFETHSTFAMFTGLRIPLALMLIEGIFRFALGKSTSEKNLAPAGGAP